MHNMKKKGGNASKKRAKKKLAQDKNLEAKLKPLIERLRGEVESSILRNPNYMNDDADLLDDGSF